MTQSYVSRDQRFRRNGLSCPICGGYPELKQGRGVRCAGYLSADGEYAFCAREEYAGNLEPRENTLPATFKHKLYGACNCGKEHNPARISQPGQVIPLKRDQPQPIEYSYLDAHGRLAYVTVRYDYPDHKDFKQKQPDGKGGWTWNLQGVTKLPYRLPELLKASLDCPVYICEGEKAVEEARHLGVIATTNVGGAGNWSPNLAPYFKGRKVIILPDNDEKGIAHAKKVMRALTGIAASVKILDLPDLPEKGDIVEWVAAGGTREQLEQMSKPALPTTNTFADLMSRELPPIRWIVPEILAEGLTLLAGKQKLGKSWLLLALGLAVAMGGLFLQSIQVEQCEVLYLALEDNERRLQDRLRQLLPPGASAPAGFHYALRWPRLDAEGLSLLNTWLDEHPCVKLVIIDTWGRAKPLSRLRNGYDADIDAASGIQALAMERNIGILATLHLRKEGAVDALDEINATSGLSATADNILILKRERGKADASLFGTGREIELDKALAFNDGHWKLLGEGVTYRLSQEQQEVIDAIEQAGKPIGAKEIAEFLSVSGKEVKPGAIRGRLYKMKEQGIIQEVSYGKYTKCANTDNTDNTANTANTANTLQESEGNPSQNGQVLASKNGANTSLTLPTLPDQPEKPTQAKKDGSVSSVSSVSHVPPKRGSIISQMIAQGYRYPKKCADHTHRGDTRWLPRQNPETGKWDSWYCCQCE